MSSLREKLTDDFKAAMKAKDTVRKDTLSFARAAIKQWEVDNREELDDQGIIDVLTKQVKMRKDALSDFEKAGRSDLAEDYNKEIAVLMEYLPKQLTEEELTEIVKAAAAELGLEGKSSMGKLIGSVMPKVKGRADGGMVKKIAEQILS